MIQTRHPSASPRLHPMDCRCSKCPDPRGTRAQRHRRFFAIVALYLIGIVAGVALLLQGGSAL